MLHLFLFIFSSEIYVTDSDIYLPMTSDVSSYFKSVPSSFSISYSNNGMTISSSSFARWELDSTYNTPKSVEFELVSHNNTTAPEFDFTSDNKYCEFQNALNKISLNGTKFDVNTVGKWRFEIDGTQIKAYKDNTLIGAINASITTIAPKIGSSINRQCTLKDFLIKPL